MENKTETENEKMKLLMWMISILIVSSLIITTATALEIKQGTSEDLTIFLQNSSSGDPLTGITCVITVWNTTNAKILDNGAMTEQGEGFYKYATNASWTGLGNYRAMVRCTISGKNVFSAMMFQMVATTTTEYLQIINQTTTNTYNYLQNTIYPQTTLLELKLNQTLTNQTNIWNKLIEIQANTTTNYNAILNAQAMINSTNTSIMTELNDHKQRLIEINTTTQDTLASIIEDVIPKLDNAQWDIDLLQSELDLVKNYVDTLEQGQANMTNKLVAIENYTDTLETGVTNIRSDITNLNATNKARFDAVDTSLSNIYTDTQSIMTSGVKLDAITNVTLYNILSLTTSSNTTINEVKAYLEGTITTYLAEINQTTHQTLTYLQNTVYPAVDTLEASMTELKSNNTNIWNKLVEIQANSTTNYNEIIKAQTMLTNANQSIMTELADHKQRLIELNSTSWNILNNITQEVIPRINTTQNTINIMRTELLLINTSLSQDNTNMSSKLNTIIGYTDTLETGVSDLKTDISNVNTTMKVRFDTVDTSLSNIYTDTQSIVNSGVKLNALTNATLYDILAKTAETNTTLHTVKTYIEGTVTSYLSEINQTTHSTYDYLQNTVYPAINTLDLKLNQTLANNTNIWNKLVEIQANSTTNYNEIIKAQTMLTNVNETMMIELLNHRQRLIEINTTTWATLNNITQEVIPKLNNAQTDIDSLQTEIGLVKNYVDTLEEGQSNMTAQLTTIQGYTDSLEAGVTNIRADITNLNSTNKARFDAVDNSLSLIYSDTQSIMTSGVKLDAITNATLNDVLAKTSETNTTIHSVKNYLEGTITQTLAQINQTILDVNASLYTKIEFESNLTRQQIMDAIKSNTTTILEGISNNTARLNTILLKWGDYDAANLSNQIIANKNKLDQMELWLDAFNDTEEARHNESMDLGEQIRTWLGFFNGTEEGRHNVTVEKLNNLLAEIDADQNLSDAIIAQLGYIGKNSTLYDDVVVLNDKNNHVISLTNEINLTTHRIDTNVIEINTTLSMVKTDTTNLLAKWGSYNSSSIMNQLNLMDGKLDIITVSSNNTPVLTAIAQMENILNSTRSELGFNGTGLSAYQYIVQLDSMIVEMNATVLNKIEFESNLTRTQITDMINANVTSIVNEINGNEAKLDTILDKWGTINAQDIISNITENRNKLTNMEAWLDAFNTTEQNRHNASMNLGQQIMNFLGIFNGTEAQRHNITVELLNDLLNEINSDQNLSNTIIAQMGFSGKNETLYDDVQTIIKQNTNITILAQEINLTTHTTVQILNQTIIPKLESMHNTSKDALAKWGTYNASQLWQKTGLVETKIDAMQFWLDSFNATEKARYTSILTEINETQDLISSMRTELGFQNKNTTVYDYMVKLDNKIVDMNSTLFIKMETEGNFTRQQLTSTIINNTNTVLEGINNNSQKLDLLLDKWGTIDAQQIVDNITATRDQLTGLENWLEELNQTEQNRTDTIMDYMNNVIFPEIDMTEELCNDLIVQMGFNESNTTAYDMLETITVQQEYMYNASVAMMNATTTLTAATINLTNTANLISQQLTIMKTTIDTTNWYATQIYNKWGAYSANDIYLKLNVIDTKISALDLSNATTILSKMIQMETTVNAMRTELGLNGTSKTAYGMLLDLQTQLGAVNSTLYAKMETEGNLTRTQIMNKINESTGTILTEVNENENHLHEILANSGNATANYIIGNITAVRNQMTNLEGWLNTFNTTEQGRHDDESTAVQAVMDWLNIFGTTETGRHTAIMSNLTQTMNLVTNTEQLANDIIAQIAYNETNSTVYEDIQQLIANTVNITGGAGTLTGVNYVALHNGSNMIALPMQPANASIPAIMAPIAGNYYRVDWYNTTNKQWLTYNPSDPFANTLFTMETNKAYWVWVQEDTILFIQ